MSSMDDLNATESLTSNAAEKDGPPSSMSMDFDLDFPSQPDHLQTASFEATPPPAQNAPTFDMSEEALDFGLDARVGPQAGEHALALQRAVLEVAFAEPGGGARIGRAAPACAARAMQQGARQDPGCMARFFHIGRSRCLEDARIDCHISVNPLVRAPLVKLTAPSRCRTPYEFDAGLRLY